MKNERWCRMKDDVDSLFDLLPLCPCSCSCSGFCLCSSSLLLSDSAFSRIFLKCETFCVIRCLSLFSAITVVPLRSITLYGTCWIESLTCFLSCRTKTASKTLILLSLAFQRKSAYDLLYSRRLCSLSLASLCRLITLRGSNTGNVPRTFRLVVPLWCCEGWFYTLKETLTVLIAISIITHIMILLILKIFALIWRLMKPMIMIHLQMTILWKLLTTFLALWKIFTAKIRKASFLATWTLTQYATSLSF